MTEDGEEEGEEEAEPAPGYLVWPLFLLEAVTPLLHVGLSAPGHVEHGYKVHSSHCTPKKQILLNYYSKTRHAFNVRLLFTII